MICSLAVFRNVRLRLWRLTLATLLVLPPCLRLLLESPAPEARDSPDETKALKIEISSLRRELTRARAELEAQAAFKATDRQEVALARILPLSDPSPSRGVMWGHIPSGRAIPVDSAVLWKAPPDTDGSLRHGQALVGRVLSEVPGAAIVRIQTLFDPEFRVRFKHAGASGILWGTDRRSNGLPILEIRHLTQLVELKEGEALVTEGHDGVYPEGLLIGFVEREGPNEPSLGAEKGHLRVRAAVSPTGLSEVAIAIDQARESLTTILERSAREEGSP